jgi:hypothetical protein
MKRQSSKRAAKRDMILAGGDRQPSAKAAFAVNTNRSSAADRPRRVKTKSADRARKRGER